MFYLARTIDQRDDTLAAQLERVHVAQQALDRKLDQIVNLFEQYAEASARERLESLGCVVQANEVIRHLVDDVHRVPALTANAVAVAVGAILATPPAHDGERSPVIYLVPTGETAGGVLHLVPAPLTSSGEALHQVSLAADEIAA